MKKVLFSFVGEQDPVSAKTNEEGSIVTLYQHIKPDYVYLFPTAKGINIKSHTEGHAIETEKWIKELIDPNANIFIRPLLINPVVYEEILGALYLEIPKVLDELNKLGEDFEINLNCSSGTPQLKSSWLILAYGRHVPNPRLWQVYNPQYAQPGKRLEEIKIDFIEEKSIINRIHNYTELGFFGVVKIEATKLKEISINSIQKHRAQLVSEIFGAYENWDLMKYKEAYEKISKVYREYSNSQDLKEVMDILGMQKDYLNELKKENGKETIYNLVDLYYNAKRRLDKQDYTETLARFWRIYEGTLYLYMREHYNIEPTNLTESSDRKLADEIKGYLNLRDSSMPLGIYNSEKVLTYELKDKYFISFIESEIEVERSASKQKKKIKDVLTELRNKRNKSIVAHGMKPVEEIDAINSIIVCEEIIKKIVLEEESYDLNIYPFKRENYMKVMEKLLA